MINLPSCAGGLADRVDSALEKSPYFPHRGLRFELQQGCVILRGAVDSFFQKQMAQEAVRAIEGVESVENQLEVHWP